MGLQDIFFYYFAIVAVVTALMAITRHNPVHSVLFLVPCFFHIAGLFILLGAEFLAAIQILVYTGAIMVLYLFVIALLNLTAVRGRRITHRQSFLAAITVLILVVQLVVLAVTATFPGPFAKFTDSPFLGNTEAVGAEMYTTFLFPFELASLVLLVAIFGAVVLAKREAGE